MPDTLAHLGVQGLLTRRAIRGADVRWIGLGCVIPDVPWILHRAVPALSPLAVSSYDLLSYAIVQSSLFFSLILCVGLAMLAAQPRRALAILSLNTFLHLLLDSLQTRWGNGAQFFVPFSWRQSSFGLFWPESVTSVALALLGAAFVGWAWWREPGEPTPLEPRTRGAAVGLALIALYALLPLAFLREPERAGNHGLDVLCSPDSRVGRDIELDRDEYVTGPGGARIRTVAGELLAVRGPQPASASTISIRGRFVTPDTVEIRELHVHWPGVRDLLSYVGLAAVALSWAWPAAGLLGRCKTAWRNYR